MPILQSIRSDRKSMNMARTNRKGPLSGPALLWAVPALVFLSGCAQTNSLMGNHQNAAFNYRSSAKSSEKEAKKEAGLQNHLIAAKKYIDAANSRISSAQEYQNLGNPVWAKNMFEKASTDLSTASTEIRSAGEAETH